MLGIRRKLDQHYQNLLLCQGNGCNVSQFDRLLLLYYFRQELKRETKHLSIQNPIAARVNSYASLTNKFLGDFMPNNLGNWTIKTPELLTHRLEKKSIEIVKKYFHAPTEILGHFSSGSTEGNIYATWIGRNYLFKELDSNHKNKKIALLKTSLAHYSIDKAADLCQVQVIEVDINEEKWNIDEKSLFLTLEQLYQKGYRGFLIPLTLGYTITGTEDDYKTINKLIENFHLKHKDCKCFVWLDAAFSGVSKIFLEKVFKPFDYSQIQLITTDLHKFLAVPYPAGLILYRPQFIQYIQRNIFYIDQMDTTLLGSRPGNNVLASWFSLINLNPHKMQNTLAKCLEKKEKFLSAIKKLDKKITIINNPYSLQACLLVQTNNQILIKKIENKYSLRHERIKIKTKGAKKTFIFYKLYFFPSL